MSYRQVDGNGTTFLQILLEMAQSHALDLGTAWVSLDEKRSCLVVLLMIAKIREIIFQGLSSLTGFLVISVIIVNISLYTPKDIRFQRS